MKFLRILFVLNMLVFLVGCGNEVASKEDNLTENVMIVNPIKESSQEELETLFDFTLNDLSDFKDISFTTINTEPMIGQINFYFEENDFCLRFQKTEEFQPLDISGLYYEWDKEIEDIIGDFETKIYLKDDIGFISWIDFKNKIAFNLSMKENATEEILRTVSKDYFILDKNYFFNYVMDIDDEIIFKPSLFLDKKNKTFTFSYDPLSSYLSYGHYEEADNIIYCLTDDLKYNYVFEIIDEQTLSFKEEESSPLNFIDNTLEENYFDYIFDGVYLKLEKL